MPKSVIRAHVNGLLKKMSTDKIVSESDKVVRTLLESPLVVNSTTVSVYLAMPREVQTTALVAALFEAGKRVYVPKITGDGSSDMVMLHVSSFAELDHFPKNKWNIPEPPLEELEGHADSGKDDIDLVIIPGLAFDRDCNRLGRGRGYYDYFLDTLNRTRHRQGLSAVRTVGLAFNEQLVEQVPLESHDVPLHWLATPNDLFRSNVWRC